MLGAWDEALLSVTPEFDQIVVAKLQHSLRIRSALWSTLTLVDLLSTWFSTLSGFVNMPAQFVPLGKLVATVIADIRLLRLSLTTMVHSFLQAVVQVLNVAVSRTRGRRKESINAVRSYRWECL